MFFFRGGKLKILSNPNCFCKSSCPWWHVIDLSLKFEGRSDIQIHLKFSNIIFLSSIWFWGTSKDVLKWPKKIMLFEFSHFLGNNGGCTFLPPSSSKIGLFEIVPWPKTKNAIFEVKKFFLSHQNILRAVPRYF